jgi:hypothetical protein
VVVTGCRAIFALLGCTVSPIRGEATGGGVQGASQVAGDGDQAVVHLMHLGAHLHQLLVGLDTSEGLGLGFGVGADVLSLTGAIILGGMDEVEVAGLAVVVFASEGWPGRAGVLQGGRPQRIAPRCRSSFGSFRGMRLCPQRTTTGTHRKPSLRRLWSRPCL